MPLHQIHSPDMNSNLKHQHTPIFTLLLGAILLLCLAFPAPAAEVANLRCEHLQDPLGIDVPTPRLSWIVTSDRRGELQTAYQILVASSPDLLAKETGDLWDSGNVASAQSVLVPYSGKPLASRQFCHWKVRLWDRDGRASAWSQPAFWSMGLLKPEDWHAKWIIAAPESPSAKPDIRPPLLRTAFQISKPVRRAQLAITGLGFFEARLNGAPLGDAVLEPDWTNYRKTCCYRVHDVTSRLTPGENVLGVLLGNGMYRVTGGRYVKFTGSFGPPKLIAQLEITYTDGTTQRVVTDPSWRVADGPITFTCIFGGEDYDARRELPGWDRPGFDASNWRAARECVGPGGQLTTRCAPPNKVMREFKPVRVTQPKPGVWVYDLGQNFSGWPRLAVEGKAGATVRLTPGELLATNGTVSQRSSGGPMWFAYTLKGGGLETWHPRFSYYGFRYVQVEGAAPADATNAPRPPAHLRLVPQGAAPADATNAPPDLPRVRDLAGEFIYAAAATVGEIACSDPDIGRIHQLIRAAILSNLKSVLTDCPHREKLGWLEVSHLLASGVMYNLDAPTFYAKICQDMRDAQLPNGLVPDIAPEYVVFQGGFRDSPEWGSACAVNPWMIWQQYGDRRPLEEQYECIKRYVAYLGGTAKDHLVSHGLGDWYDVGPGAPGVSQLTSPGVTATAVYFQDVEILRQAAALLGRAEDAGAYKELAAQIQAAFNARFLHPDTAQYDRGSQTAQAMPLALGLVPEPLQDRVLDRLIADVRDRGYRVTAGDVGFSYLVRALTDAERGDVLYRMAKQPDGPGYLYQLKQQATALTEAWNADPASSQNHCMLGHIEDWFFRGLAGIRPDPAGPGFARIIIRPQPIKGLTWASGSYDSIRGRIAAAWKRENGNFLLDITIPANTTATVFLPARDPATVTESGHPAGLSEAVRLLRAEAETAVYAVGSGAYHFTAP